MGKVSMKHHPMKGSTHNRAEQPMLQVTCSSHTFVRYPRILFKGQTAYRLYRFLCRTSFKRPSIHLSSQI